MREGGRDREWTDDRNRLCSRYNKEARTTCQSRRAHRGGRCECYVTHPPLLSSNRLCAQDHCVRESGRPLLDRGRFETYDRNRRSRVELRGIRVEGTGQDPLTSGWTVIVEPLTGVSSS